MPFPSSCWLIHFSDLHGTLFKGIYLLLSIEFCCKNWGNVSENRKKVRKREYGMHSVSSKIILQTRKHLVFKLRLKLINLNIILKGELKKTIMIAPNLDLFSYTTFGPFYCQVSIPLKMCESTRVKVRRPPLNLDGKRGVHFMLDI